MNEVLFIERLQADVMSVFDSILSSDPDFFQYAYSVRTDVSRAIFDIHRNIMHHLELGLDCSFNVIVLLPGIAIGLNKACYERFCETTKIDHKYIDVTYNSTFRLLSVTMGK